MTQTIINTISPIIMEALVAIVVAVITLVSNTIRSYYAKKQLEIQQKIGVDKYNAELTMGKSIWNIVEEYARTTSLAEKTKEKQEMFDKLLKEKLPYLTDNEIANIRQAIAGEMNAWKTQIFQPTTPIQISGLKHIESNTEEIPDSNTVKPADLDTEHK